MNWKFILKRVANLVLDDLRLKTQSDKNDVQVHLIFSDLRIFAIWPGKVGLRSDGKQAERNSFKSAKK